MAALDGTNLHTLNLENNYLEFANIEGSDVNIEKLSPFQNLTKLRVLNMRNNSMKNFLIDWSTANVELEELDLSYNGITEIDFQNNFNIWLKPLTVNLTNNKIVTINTGEGFASNNNPMKSTWILNNNPLKCDCLIIHFVHYIQNKLKMMSDARIEFVTNDLKCATPNQFVGQSPINVALKHLICPLDKHSSSDKKCPNQCDCYVRTIDSTAIFNCSNTNLSKIPQLPDIRSLGLKFYELHIENNNITTLTMANTTGYRSVNHIFAKNNSIDKPLPEHLPNNLVSLDLSNNKLQRISSFVLSKLSHIPTFQNLSISQNPWICDSGAYDLQQFIRKYSNKIIDINDITCDNGHTSLVKVDDLGPTEKSSIMIVVVVLIALLLLITTFYYKYQQEIMVWIFAHFEFLWFYTNQDFNTDDNKKFDAFILYSIKDIEFVCKNLIPELENGSKPLKLCSLDSESKAGDFMPNLVI